MKKFSSLLIFLSLFCIKSNVVFAEDVPCGEIVPEPEVFFTTSYGNLRYDREKTKAELTEIGKTYGIGEKGLFAAGLSTIKVNWEISIDTINKFSEDGEEICVIPIKINLHLGYEDPAIYLSKELTEGTCAYDVVLRHEQTHQQINKVALDYFAPRIKANMQNIAAEIGTEKIVDLDEISSVNGEITKKYISFVEPMINTFKSELKKEQSKLDNAENYHMEGELCK